MSYFTFAELLKGAERSTRKPEVLRRLDELARVVSVRYGVNRALWEHYAMQFSRLREAGTTIGANDLWIACHTLAKDCTVVTNNTREFERLAGLKLESWALSPLVTKAITLRAFPPTAPQPCEGCSAPGW